MVNKTELNPDAFYDIMDDHLGEQVEMLLNENKEPIIWTITENHLLIDSEGHLAEVEDDASYRFC